MGRGVFEEKLRAHAGSQIRYPNIKQDPCKGNTPSEQNRKQRRKTPMERNYKKSAYSDLPWVKEKKILS